MIASSGHRGKRFAGIIEYRAVSERFRNPAAMPDLPAAGDAPPTDENGLPDLVAAVDLGSNSFHMKIARVVGGELQVVDRMREMVRLAAGLDAANRVTAGAAERALGCLSRFGQRLRELPSESVRAVGTNTFRRARDGTDFLSAAEDALGHSIEVIDGREEARLIYLGVSHGIAADERQRLVVDIGGGSTELIIGRHFSALHTESLYMGCVSSSIAHFGDGRIRRAGMRAAELDATAELEPIRARYRAVGWEAAVGASGTIRAIDDLLRARGWSAEGITREGLRRLRDALIDTSRVEALTRLGVEPDRAAVFPGGVAILGAIFEALRIRRMTATESALRDGVLYDLIGRLKHHDVRDTTIRNLSRRFQVDTEQAERVERTALYLLRQVAKAWRLRRPHYGDWLSWAARLHEVGLDIAHNQYHKHGAYLLEHGDLPGFSRQEKQALSVLVRAHRRKFPAGAFDLLGERWAERAMHLAIVLRVAVVLHRGRTDAGIPGIVAQASPRMLRLAFPPGWLDAHPLTFAELGHEAGYLSVTGIKLRFN